MGDIAEGFLDGTFSEDGEYIDSGDICNLHGLCRNSQKISKVKIPKEEFCKMLEDQEKKLGIKLSSKAKNRLANRSKSVFEAFVNNGFAKELNKTFDIKWGIRKMLDGHIVQNGVYRYRWGENGAFECSYGSGSFYSTDIGAANPYGWRLFNE